MRRVLTGIQSTGIPHLGNIMGSILPALNLARSQKEPAFFFVADLHTLTSPQNPQERKQLSYAVAATWLAAGLDLEKDVLYRQSRVPIVCELAWYLSTSTPYPMLANGHAFKEKMSRLADVNVGLFTYPILMAADILLYDATHVPVGKDQQQHLEITRDIAQSMNHHYGDLFLLPQAIISQHTPRVSGTDGRKMSKSYGNVVNVFLPDKALRKVIMSIKTDSTPLEAPKNPATCPVFNMYSALASTEATQAMKRNYMSGRYGYGDAKKELYALITERFRAERMAFRDYIEAPTFLEEHLQKGEERAREIASQKIELVKKKLGY